MSGPFHIQPFGIFVGSTLLTWVLLTFYRARATGVNALKAVRLLESVLIAGLAAAATPSLIVGRLVFSSIAGAFGALLGGAAFFAWNRIDAPLRWSYLDTPVWAFPFGWTLLRLGCFLRHEHPGIRSDSWLAVGCSRC